MKSSPRFSLNSNFISYIYRFLGFDSVEYASDNSLKFSSEIPLFLSG